MKIFLSSTNYDQKYLLDHIESELKKWGHEIVSSNSSTIPIDSEKYSYELCIQAVQNCDCLVGIIGARFGGDIKDGIHKGKSITQLEIETAFENHMQVFIFVNQSVWDGREGYKSYKKAGTAFIPTKFADNEGVYNFIDSIAIRQTGNWIERFDNATHILSTLEHNLQPPLESERSVVEICLEAKFIDYDTRRLTELLQPLKLISADYKLKIISKEEGSVILKVNISKNGLDKLKASFLSGELSLQLKDRIKWISSDEILIPESAQAGIKYLFNKLGNLISTNQFILAANLLLEALAIAERENYLTDIATASCNLGSVYEKMNDFPKALIYHQKALQTEKIIGAQDGDFDDQWIATHHRNIGRMYQKLNMNELALENLKKAHELYLKIGNANDAAYTFQLINSL